MRRTYVRVDLALEGRWRVGTWQDDSGRVTQSTLRNPFDESLPAIPPSGLAGSLRRHVASTGGEDVAERLLGPHLDERGSSDKATISPWWFLGTRLSNGDLTIETRTQTAINRRRQAAARHSVHHAEEVKPVEVSDAQESQVALYLSHDGEQPEELYGYVETWAPVIGGGRSRGLGRARVTAYVHRTFDLSVPADLKDLVLAEGSGPERLDGLLAEGHRQEISQNEEKPLLRAVFRLPYGLGLSQSDAESLGPWWYHGSQWKGVLRSRVEYIGRSRGHNACQPPDGEADDRRAWSGCGTCDVCQAFGSSESASLWEFETARIEGGTQVKRTRVAIDPFSGGVSSDARGGATFPDSSLQGTPTIQLVIHQRARVDSAWVEQALLHAISDLADGLVAIGPRGATGLGTLVMQSFQSSAPIGGLEPVSLAESQVDTFAEILPPVSAGVTEGVEQ